jgi:hypothetical protein
MLRRYAVTDQPVLPRITTRTEADARHALARDLLRICHQHGPQRVGLTVGCDEKTIRDARDEKSTLKLHNAFNLLAIDEGALDSLAAEWGFQLVRLPAYADDCHATVDCSRPVPHLALAQAPDSDGGTDLTIRELLSMEQDIRASHRMTGRLIARIDEYRREGRRSA